MREVSSHFHPSHHWGVPWDTSNCASPVPSPPHVSPGCRHVSPAILSSPALRSPAMAPYITIIAGCQPPEAGSQDHGGASTPLATCHTVPAGLWSSPGYFRKPNSMGRRSTSHKLDPGSSCHRSDPDFSFAPDGKKGQESPLAPDPNFWLGGIQGFRSACWRDASICKTWIWSPSHTRPQHRDGSAPHRGTDPQTPTHQHSRSCTASASHRCQHSPVPNL